QRGHLQEAVTDEALFACQALFFCLRLLGRVWLSPGGFHNAYSNWTRIRRERPLYSEGGGGGCMSFRTRSGISRSGASPVRFLDPLRGYPAVGMTRQGPTRDAESSSE